MDKIESKKDRDTIAKIIEKAYGLPKDQYVVSDHRQLTPKSGDYLLLLRHEGDFYGKSVKGDVNFRVYIRVDTKNNTIQEIARFSERPQNIVVKNEEDFVKYFPGVDWNEDVKKEGDKYEEWEHFSFFKVAYEGTILMAFKILVGKSEKMFICTQKSLDMYSNYWMKENVSFGNMYDSVENSSNINYKLGEAYQIILRHPYNQIVTSGPIKPELYLTKEMTCGEVTSIDKLSNNEWMSKEIEKEGSLVLVSTKNDILYAKDKDTGLFIMPIIATPQAILRHIFDDYGNKRIGGDVLHISSGKVYHFINEKKSNDLKIVGNSNSLKKYYLEGKDKTDFKKRVNLLPDAFAQDIKIIDTDYEKQLKEMKEKVKGFISDIKKKKINVKKIEEQLPGKENIEDHLVVLAAELYKEGKRSDSDITSALKQRKYLFVTK